MNNNTKLLENPGHTHKPVMRLNKKKTTIHQNDEHARNTTWDASPTRSQLSGAAAPLGPGGREGEVHGVVGRGLAYAKSVGPNPLTDSG